MMLPTTRTRTTAVAATMMEGVDALLRSLLASRMELAGG
jgi:hypothetical protein